MANLPQQDTIVQYDADGVTTVYLVPFYTPVEDDGGADLAVYVTLSGADPIPEDDIKVYGVDYTYTSNLDPISGGYITFLTGKVPPLSSTVTIVRDVQASLDVEFSNATNFSGANLDDALDKLLLICQQNKSYAFDRNISYIVNSFREDTNIYANTQVPLLGENQIWKGQSGGVIAATLEENPDSSTLRSDLANELPTVNGASLVGYYDSVNTNPTTVKAFLDNLPVYLNAFLATYIEGGLASSTLVFKPGMMSDFAGTAVPTGWLLCDGSAVSRTTYAALFTAIGTTWGVGNGSTTFNIPDFRRRTAIGSGGSGTGTIGNAVGNTGGEETHTLIVSEMPAHTHALTPYTNSLGASGSGVRTFDSTGSLTTTSTGGDGAHNNMQPSAVVYKIIKI